MNRPSYIISSTFISISFDDGFSTTVYVQEPKYNALKDALKEDDFVFARELVEPKKQIAAAIERYKGNVRLEDGVVYYNDEPIHNTLTERILDMLDEGFNVDPMMTFLENLMENPSFRAVNELYGFLESSKLPITEDGHFLAYKRIDKDYKDIYTHRIDNSIGALVEVSRNKVDEDCNRTCSHGLHFCAREYLPSYGSYSGNRTVMVKINPKDVVAIPSDYNNAKGRCCKYVVIRELEHTDEERLEKAYYPLEEDEEDETFTDNLESEMADELDEVLREIEDRTKPYTKPYTKPFTTPITKPFVTSPIASEILCDLEEKNKTPKLDENTISPNTVNKNTKPKRGVAQLDKYKIVRAIYPSALAAMDKTGVDASSIKKVCKGKRSSAGGVGWCWIDEIDNKANRSKQLDEDDDSREENDFWELAKDEEDFFKSLP